ncbi:MAG: hypothetical protein KGZ39_01210 [Simkania sp.]|nr:hypothetical protein [Simkania sp.]
MIPNTSSAPAPPPFLVRAWNETHEFSLDYPLASLTTTLALSALGLTMISSAPFVAGTIPLSLLGIVSMGASSPFALAMIKNYRHLLFAFTPSLGNLLNGEAFAVKSCRGGKLYYQNGIPVLHITASTNKEAGITQGYLTGKNIHEIWKRYIQVLIPFYARSLHGYENLKKTVSSLHVPQPYQEELQGIVEGYNRWLTEYKQEKGLVRFGQPLTYQDLLLWHAMIDLLKKNGTPSALSSNVIISSENAKGQIAIGRNLDIPSMNFLGHQSLLIRRHIKGQLPSITISLPGSVGSFTGINQHGVFAALNDAGRAFHFRGIPSSIFLRFILDSSNSANAAKRQISNALSPASSHLLSVADAKTAFIAQFGRPYKQHPLPARGHLIATNHCIDDRGRPLPDSQNPDLSEWRKRLIENDLYILNPMPTQRKLHTVLKKVQNTNTTQTFLFQPSTGELSLGMADSYAASNDLVTFSSQQLFGK